MVCQGWAYICQKVEYELQQAIEDSCMRADKRRWLRSLEANQGVDPHSGSAQRSLCSFIEPSAFAFLMTEFN